MRLEVQIFPHIQSLPMAYFIRSLISLLLLLSSSLILTSYGAAAIEEAMPTNPKKSSKHSKSKEVKKNTHNIPKQQPLEVSSVDASSMYVNTIHDDGKDIGKSDFKDAKYPYGYGGGYPAYAYGRRGGYYRGYPGRGGYYGGRGGYYSGRGGYYGGRGGYYGGRGRGYPMYGRRPCGYFGC
ncbi:hypothetical protein ZOSMA_223G00140 [Zostera marina]|uniref:Glycine-rich protein n=1 Tax=Zostera marina TaxID=29655 RepID=A0A0K9PLA7_ZOSMR|nr:hypothetical protein ZOSMA_223G00140 [Zostera marina]